VTDREIDNMLWRAFYLGLRVMAAQTQRDVPFSEVGGLARIVREIAESETTLQDPAVLAAKFPGMAETFQRLSTQNIRSDRELATRILKGFMIATDVKE
jgi:hypothetical protein